MSISLSVAFPLIFVLLLAAAFFSAAETALTRARRVRLRMMAEEGNAGAKRAETLLAHPERMLSAVLLGSNFVSIASSSLATALFMNWFGESGIVYATVAMTIILLVFSEIIPKSIAVSRPELIACHSAWLLQMVQWLLKPLIAMLMAIIHAMQNLLDIRKGQEPEITRQELETIIGIGAETGLLDKRREQMLANSLTLHEVPVKSLMTPRKEMALLDAELTVAECLQQIRRQPHSRYPVWHGNPDNLIGVVHLRELFTLSDPSYKLKDALIWRQPPYIPDTKNALAQLIDFQKLHQHLAIVVDEFGDIEGLITLEDIIEDIVGDILDESDRPQATDIWPQPDGSILATGTASIHDINQLLDAALPEEGATTIGGLIVDILGFQPESSLCLPCDELRLEVISLKGNWIRRVRISKGFSE